MWPFRKRKRQSRPAWELPIYDVDGAASPNSSDAVAGLDDRPSASSVEMSQPGNCARALPKLGAARALRRRSEEVLSPFWDCWPILMPSAHTGGVASRTNRSISWRRSGIPLLPPTNAFPWIASPPRSVPCATSLTTTRPLRSVGRCTSCSSNAQRLSWYRKPSGGVPSPAKMD